MHWRTFDQLKAQHDAFVGVSVAGMAARFRLLERPGVMDHWLHDALDNLRDEG